MASDSSASNWKNVNNWHWLEKDCTEWSHKHLNDKLVGVESVAFAGDGEQKYRIEKVSHVDGEVSVNVRKGKVRQIFDLTIKIRVCNREGEGFDGCIQDYMSDTSFDDFELVGFGGGEGAIIIRLMKQPIWDLLESFKAELVKVHGNPMLIQQALSSPPPPLQNKGEEAPTTSEPETFKQNQKFNQQYIDKEKDNLGAKASGSFSESITFSTLSSTLQQTFTDPAQIMAWSRGTANINTFEAGASYTLLNGNIICFVRDVEEGRITLDWRLKHWPSHTVSTVAITINGNDKSSCTLNIKQTGIPAGEQDQVQQNWHRYYWEPIKSMLGQVSARDYLY